MEQVMEHSGVVERIAGDTVFVKITAGSACGACSARAVCGMGEAQERVIAVRTPQAASYAVADAVVVGVRRRTGGLAIGLAYVGALFVLLGVLAGTIGAGLSEGLAALVALGAVGVYYGVLGLFRRSIENKVQFTITKQR